MENTAAQGKSGPEAAFAAALAQFSQLLRAILVELPTSADALINNQSLVPRLAVEFERWLRDPAFLPPWMQNLQRASPFAQLLFQRGQPFNLGSLPQGDTAPAPMAQNDFVQASQRVSGLIARWSQLQAQLAMHWNVVARSAGERFIARASIHSAALDLVTIRRLYDLWIECAEQAYAATVHTDDFCRAQAESVNVTTALLLEQRRQVECFAPMFGLATRAEVDAIRHQVKRMQNESGPVCGQTAKRRRKGRIS